MLRQDIEGHRVSHPSWRAEAFLVKDSKKRSDEESRRITEGGDQRRDFRACMIPECLIGHQGATFLVVGQGWSSHGLALWQRNQLFNMLIIVCFEMLENAKNEG